MSADAAAHGDPRPSVPSVVSMRALLAAGTAASAVSTPPARERAAAQDAEGGPETDQAASESEAA